MNVKVKMIQTLLVLCSFVLLSGCQTISTQTADDFDFNAASEIITQKTELFTAAHITGDIDYLNNIFATDARIYPPNADKIASLAEISAINAQYVEYGISEFSEISTNRYGGPAYIIDEGTYTMTYGPENTSESGHYINIWKYVDGEWKLYSNTWTVLPASDSE